MSALTCLVVLCLSACGSSDQAQAIDEGPYHAYLARNSTLLIAALQSMLAEIRDGELARAQSRYARARVRYSQIEPAAEELSGLDRQIDGLEQEVPPSQFSGFHRIEKALWLDETTAGMTPVAEGLVDDAKQLRSKLRTMRFSAPQMADSMSRILAEISSSKLKGKEEPYSQTALVDVSANIEGVSAIADAMRPSLEDDPTLDSALHSSLKRAYTEMTHWGTPASAPDQPRGLSPGALFVWFEDLSPAAIAKIEERIEAIRKPVSELRAQLRQS